MLRPLILSIMLILPIQSHANGCGTQGVALQVLGSGGPEVQDKRASSSYLIWHNGQARVLIDSGGGSALRFGESNANMASIISVLFTHLHADHTADFAALIKSSYFENRVTPLPVYGPDGNKLFPSTAEFIKLILGPEGAYRYLSDYLSDNGSDYQIRPHNISAKDSKVVFNHDNIRISATDVSHGSVPALAWRIDIDGKSITFSGDTNGDTNNLSRLAENSDILVAHNAVPEGASGVALRLHMPPTTIGKIAAQANAKQLVLSHRMLRTLGKEEQTLSVISNYYTGKISFANDLDCFTP